MTEHRHIWTVIPVYNHAATLREVVAAAARHPPRVLVVDDGSTDADVTALLADQGVPVVVHPRNLGKGAALRTAAQWLARQQAEFMISLDADGQHDPDDLPRFLPLLTPGAPHLVIGVRDFATGYIPGRSRLGRALSNFWIRLETGTSVADSQSGFRAYPVRLLAEFSCHAEGFAFETEILVRGCWAGLRLVQVPVAVHYPPPGQRITHFSCWRDTLAIARTHARLIASRRWFAPAPAIFQSRPPVAHPGDGEP